MCKSKVKYSLTAAVGLLVLTCAGCSSQTPDAAAMTKQQWQEEQKEQQHNSVEPVAAMATRDAVDTSVKAERPTTE